MSWVYVVANVDDMTGQNVPLAVFGRLKDAEEYMGQVSDDYRYYKTPFVDGEGE